MPKLSIIVPVYNTENYLERCLTSLSNQTLDDIEILVVNDGSTDNSKKIIERFCKKFPSKIIFLEKENGGLSDARNFGIQHASGEYLGFVDSDDFIEPSMYEEMYDLAKAEDLDLVECDFSWDFPNKSKIDTGLKYTKIEDYFTYGRVMACNKIYKSSIIKNNNISFPYGLLYEDIEFFYKLVPYINKSSYINKIFYHYVQRENSIIYSTGKNADNIFIVLNNIVYDYKLKKIYNEYESYLEYLFIRLLMGSSFLRIIKINDKTLKKELLRRSYEELNTHYPNWKKNIYLNKNKTMKNLYYKSINKFTYKFYTHFFKIFKE